MKLSALPIILILFYYSRSSPYTLINKVVTDCEYYALGIGTRLADFYNSYDEETEWDMRIHHDYLTEHLGFAGWIQMGLWKSGGLTATRQNAGKLHRNGGWAGSKNISDSAYWAFDNKWIYMMGDSTQRQIWATFVSPFQNNEFERNAKEWTRENCARQFPHRMKHLPGDFFPEEGWGGKCGNNEVTCDLSGFGVDGKLSFDWKHFPYEDYDEWLFGENGKWSGNDTMIRHPDVLIIQVGLHTCFHAFEHRNSTMIENHRKDIRKMMTLIKKAMDRSTNLRPNSNESSKLVGKKTMVIFQLPGRIGGSDPYPDHCLWSLNRLIAYEAHLFGFAVLEREEIERRLQFKSEYYPYRKVIKSVLHLENPSPNIVGTSLLALVSCLLRNGSSINQDNFFT